MDLNKFGPRSHTSLHQRSTGHNPYDALRPPTVIRAVESKLLLEKDRPDGGVDQLVHEAPSRYPHPGALFYVTDVPASNSNDASEPSPFHRVLCVTVPKENPEQFIARVVAAFNDLPPTDFAHAFKTTFGAEQLVLINRQ